MSLTLGKLLLLARQDEPQVGDISGTCVLCSRPTEQGQPIKKVVSNNFMGWPSFFSGNCFCPACAYLFSDQTFRKKSWVASVSGGFRIFRNDEAQEILFNPPQAPFFIHIAKRGQKQTWLSCLNRIASNPNRYWFSHESYDIPILFERERAREYAKWVDEALEFGLTKTELISGQFKPKSWEKAYKQGRADMLRRLGALKGDPLWEVIVDVARK